MNTGRTFVILVEDVRKMTMLFGIVEVQHPVGMLQGVDALLKFKVDGAGRPIAFLFTPPSTTTFQYSYVPLAIGRVEPL
jgi:hypothetical protein